MFKPHLNMFTDVWGGSPAIQKKPDTKLTAKRFAQVFDRKPTAPSSKKNSGLQICTKTPGAWDKGLP